MYGFDESTGAPSNKYLPAGINENVELKEVLFEPLRSDGTGDEVLKFLFSNAQNEAFTFIEYPMDFDSLVEKAKGWKNTTAEAEAWVKQQFEAQGERIKHILSAFIPKDKCVFRANSFKDFADGVIKMLGTSHHGVLVRVKVVYRREDDKYTSFPKRAFKPFIQPMSEPNRIKIDPKWDIIENVKPDTSGDTWAANESSNESATTETTGKVPW